jgi:muconolactone delta-isomerase
MGANTGSGTTLTAFDDITVACGRTATVPSSHLSRLHPTVSSVSRLRNLCDNGKLDALQIVFKAYRLGFTSFVSKAAQELDQKIQEVYRRIQTERKILEATQILRQATPNPDVLRMNDAKIKETERSLLYFENTLKELQARKLQLAERDDPSRSPPSGALNLPRQTRHERDRSLPPTPPYYGDDERNPPDAGGTVPKAKPYSNLDLIKADTPHTTAKISKMLHQLEFKLQVEKQYKEGIAKMSSLYQADGDKKSRADAETKKIESDRKILLLQSALKRYKNLHILDEADDDEAGAILPNMTLFEWWMLTICAIFTQTVPLSRARGRRIFAQSPCLASCRSPFAVRGN